VSTQEPSRPPEPPPTQPTRPLGAPRQPSARVEEERYVEQLAPEPPPEDRWWTNPWAAIVAAILGVIAGVLIGLAVGGKNKTVTETLRAGQSAPARTVTQKQPTVEVRTKTVTATSSTPSPASAESEARGREAEQTLRTVEKENRELKRQLEERSTP
jgi:hypothetical protein